MICWAQPIQRRDRKAARVVCMDVRNGGGSDRRPILVLVQETIYEKPVCYHQSGFHFGGMRDDPEEHPHDIINI